MEPSTKRLLTLEQCEAITGRKISTWRKAIYRREIPYVRIGRSVRIPEEVIQDMIEKGWCAPVERQLS